MFIIRFIIDEMKNKSDKVIPEIKNKKNPLNTSLITSQIKNYNKIKIKFEI